MRSFVRYYEFLCRCLALRIRNCTRSITLSLTCWRTSISSIPVLVLNLDGKIKASNFIQKKGEEHLSPNLVAKPVTKLPTAEHFGLTEDKEQRLSEIIDEINSRTGISYDNDVVVKAMLQIRDILMKSERLKTSAKNNTRRTSSFLL